VHVQRAAAAAGARDGARPADSPFRRRWSWRTQAWVVVAGWVVALVLRLLHLTLRVQLIDRGDVLARRRTGQQILAAFWHDGIVLLPLMMTRLAWPGTANVMLSWHRDAEIAAQAMRRLGIRTVRGSATRGWLGGLRGLLAARARGEDIVIVPDGPRGPRREAKDGVIQLARATRLPLVVIGAAAWPARRLGSWDRMQLPRPFARVALVMSAVELPADKVAARAALEAALDAANAEAAAVVGAHAT
jgi:lysophospholipid acyltransferase (LPLAT)-like uncharacterized protein